MGGLPLLLVPLLVAVAVVAGIVYAYYAKQRRRDELAEFAAGHGLEYSPVDTRFLDQLPFHLFSLGDGRGCENVLTGTWDGKPVTGADYWYYTESTDSKGNHQRNYHRFSVVLTDIALWLPAVRIEHESVLTRLGHHLGFGDIEFESEDFNRRFRVSSADREFAFKLIDARLMAWLLRTAGDHCYEVGGGQVLAYTGKRAPPELTTVFLASTAFVDHIPRLVWSEYGTKEAPR